MVLQNNRSRHCGWRGRILIGRQRRGPIWKERKDDPNNASCSACGYTHTHTHTHAQTHTQVPHSLCVAFLGGGAEEQRSRHRCLPELLLRRGRRKDSQFWFHKTTLSLAACDSFCLFDSVAPASSFPCSALCPTRWRGPRLQGLSVSVLPNRPPFASSTSAGSSRWRWSTTPKATILCGR